MPLREAIVESCRTRLRPILMTTTAIIAGLIPTSLGIGIGGTRSRGDCGDHHRRPVAVPVPDAAARAGGLREVRRARAGGGGEAAKAWLARVSAATVGRLRPASESRQG